MDLLFLEFRAQNIYGSLHMATLFLVPPSVILIAPFRKIKGASLEKGSVRERN